MKTPNKAKKFAAQSGLPEDYVLILRREVYSYLPKPVNLDKFPGIKKEPIDKLNNIGIKNTLHLFNRVKTPDDRNEVASETGLSNDEIMRLTKFCDLSRVKWMGPIFARLFLESKADTVEKLSESNPEILYEKLVEINNSKGYTKAKFVENDVRLCVNIAKMVPNVIKY